MGLGWFSRSCMECTQCLAGQHHLCAKGEGTIVGRHGGFANYVRCHHAWAIPSRPESTPQAGPLYCGGITVFAPSCLRCSPHAPRGSDRHRRPGPHGHPIPESLGLRSRPPSPRVPDKETEARCLGAHHFVSSRDAAQLKKVAGSFDFILSTVNASLDWGNYVDALAPRGRLHVVGAVPEPIPVTVFSLLIGQKSISGSPTGSPVTMGSDAGVQREP